MFPGPGYQSPGQHVALMRLFWNQANELKTEGEKLVSCKQEQLKKLS